MGVRIFALDDDQRSGRAGQMDPLAGLNGCAPHLFLPDAPMDTG